MIKKLIFMLLFISVFLLIGCSTNTQPNSNTLDSPNSDNSLNTDTKNDFDTSYNQVASSGIGKECGYVRSEGTDIKTKYYKSCSTGSCMNVNCDFLFMSSIPSEGKLYNCYGTCQKSTTTRKTSSGQYCVFIKLTGNPGYNMLDAAKRANQNACPSGETCMNAGDCKVTIDASDATLWDCDGVCQ